MRKFPEKIGRETQTWPVDSRKLGEKIKRKMKKKKKKKKKKKNRWCLDEKTESGIYRRNLERERKKPVGGFSGFQGVLNRSSKDNGGSANNFKLSNAYRGWKKQQEGCSQ